MTEITFTRPTLYAYDPTTGEHRGTAQAEIDIVALAHDVLRFVAPAFTTTTAPPEVPNGSAAVWSAAASSWSLVADHRGETWWQGDQPVTIATLGDPAAAGLVRSRPVVEPAPVDLAAAQRSTLIAKIGHLSSLGAGYASMRQPVPPDIVAEHDAAVKELRAMDEQG